MASPSVLTDIKSSSGSAGMSEPAPREVPANLDGLPVHVLAPEHGWVPVRLSELWEYRELLYFFVWRELKVRYKQTALGVAWAVIQPLFTMLIFSVIFGRLAKLPSDGLPYPVF